MRLDATAGYQPVFIITRSPDEGALTAVSRIDFTYCKLAYYWHVCTYVLVYDMSVNMELCVDGRAGYEPTTSSIYSPSIPYPFFCKPAAPVFLMPRVSLLTRP